MKWSPPAAFSLVAAVILLPASLSAQIINIDFLSHRGGESPAPNRVGAGAAGGGTTFNGLTADNADATDNIDVSGSDLLSSNDLPTLAGFSITDVGADSSGNSNLSVVNGAYVFINSANNTQTSADFTISGLTSPTANLYFYIPNTANPDGYELELEPTITLSDSQTATNYTGTGTFNSTNTIEILDVPVTDGEITGTVAISAPGQGAILGGLTISEVPEPSTWALLAVSGLVLGWRLRRGSFSF